MQEAKAERMLQKELKDLYKLYISGDYATFDRALARICEEWMQNIKVLDEVLMHRFLRRVP